MDFNFFEYYKARKSKTNMAGLIFVSIATAAVGVILIMVLFLFIQVNTLESNIKKHKKIMAEDSFVNSLVQVTELEGQLKQVKGETDAMQFFIDVSVQNHSVKREILDSISAQLVTGVSMGSLNIENGEVTLGGSFRTLNEIAQFEHNIRNSGLFEDVYVTKVFEATGDISQILGPGNVKKIPYKEAGIDYAYVMTMRIKEGTTSEEE